MKRVLGMALVVLVVPLLVGCAGGVTTFAPVIPPTGLAVSSISAPLDVNVDKTTLGSKTGESSAACVLSMVSWGDASTAAAARNGGLRVINHADYRSTNILFLYTKYTTVVYGD